MTSEVRPYNNILSRSEAGEGLMPPTRVGKGGGSESHILLKCPERQRRREEILNRKSPHINEERAIRNILIVKNVTEQRNLNTLASNNKCKWENQTKKAELRLQECQNKAVCKSERI